MTEETDTDEILVEAIEAAKTPPEPVPDAAGLPDDVEDGEIPGADSDDGAVTHTGEDT
jgi:hypothetical protein